MPGVMFNVVSDPAVNPEALGRRFRIYGSVCKDYRDRERLSNAVRRLDCVRAVLNEDSREGDARVLYLADTDPETETRIKDAVYAFSKDLVVRKVAPDLVEPRKVVGLLLNSLTSIDPDGEGLVSNAAGRCHIAWEIKGGSSDPDQIVCLSIFAKGDGDLIISCDVVSYTNIRFRESIKGEHMKFDKDHPFESFPQYRFEENRIAPAPNGYKGSRFLCRGLWKYGSSKRNRVDFLNVYEEARMLRTKSVALRDALKAFNALYGDIIRLNLSSADMRRRMIPHDFKADDTMVASILKDGVLMNDVANQPDKAKRLAEECRRQGVDATIVDGPRFGMPMIRLVNDKDEGSEDDSYGKDDISIVQHVQESSVSGKIGPTTRSILKELAIKVDIEEGRIRTFDWPSLGFDEDVVFAVPLLFKESRKPANRAGVLTVEPDGSLDFRICGDTDPGAPEWMKKLLGGGHELFVIRGTDVMSIRRTDIFPVPDVDKISERMRQNREEGLNEDVGLREESAREQYLAAVTDINWIEHEGCWYYYVGVIGHGMDTKLPTASIVRRVEPVEGTLFMEDLIPTMAVTYIRSKQSTVIPFPFKYLRECVYKAEYDVA